jgi:arsenite methyltransferase
MSNFDTSAISKRYSDLAEKSCCLSCGQAATMADPKAGETYADFGCGRGTDVLRIAEIVGEKGFVWGVDVASGMIQKAEQTATKLGTSNVRFVLTELHQTGIPSDSVDVVISNCTINHALDKAAVWLEIHRILKPGGRFVVSDIYAITEVPAEYRNNPEMVAECWAGADTKEQYLETLQNTGFSAIEIHEESLPYEKGKINVASFTIIGYKARKSCKCC